MTIRKATTSDIEAGIRRAQIQDSRAIKALLRQMLAEKQADHDLPDINVEAFNSVVSGCITEGITFVLEDPDAGITGVVMGRIEPGFWWASDDNVILGDYAFFIAPEHRNYRNFKALASEFVAVGHARGIPVHLGWMYGDPRLDALYGRIGGQKVGGIYQFLPCAK